MKYLIVKCEDINTEYKCENNRSIVALTDNWQMWHEVNKPNYDYEIYTLKEKRYGSSWYKD